MRQNVNIMGAIWGLHFGQASDPVIEQLIRRAPRIGPVRAITQDGSIAWPVKADDHAFEPMGLKPFADLAVAFQHLELLGVETMHEEYDMAFFVIRRPGGLLHLVQPVRDSDFMFARRCLYVGRYC